MAIVLAFGDSITFGLGDLEGGWVQRLRRTIDKANLPLNSSGVWHSVLNIGVEGQTTETLLERFEPEIKARLWPGSEIIILVNIGINDALFYKNRNKLWVPIEKTKENIQCLIETARKYSSNIIFIGPNPVDNTKTSPVYWDPNLSWKNEDVERYNAAIKSVCDNEKIPFLDIFKSFAENGYSNLLIDGIHPNDKGHKLMFKNIKEFLEKNQIIEF